MATLVETRYALQSKADLRKSASNSKRAGQLKPEHILSDHAPSVRKLVAQLSKRVKTTVPDATEHAYPTWHGIGYRHPQAGYFCGIFPSKKMVKLGFEYGVLLPDPHKLLRQGSTKGRKVRYLEIVSAKDIRKGQIVSFLRAAIELRSKD